MDKILKAVKLTDNQIIGLVPAAAIINFDGAEKALNTLATHFKKMGAREVTQELYNILKECKSQEDYYMRVLALTSALQEELTE